jgi:xanthine dehydrogenase accessory factor
MADPLLERAAELQRRGEPFVLATVVRCEAPTSAKPGAKALVHPDGTVEGWVGGACAEPVVTREALEALRDGRPRLVGLYGEGGRTPGRAEGILDHAMTCHSGGTLEIYVEPYLPVPLLVLVGHGPVVETLATLGRTAGYAVVPLQDDAAWAGLDALGLGRRASVVVATHADSDEDALARVLRTEAGYVSLVASRRRAASVVERLRQRGVPSERLGRFKAPAGLDLGAVTPAEIAVSILAEIIQHHRGDKLAEAAPPAMAAEPTEAIDPICGMTVEIATARYRSLVEGRTTYFCCLHCKETFEQDPRRYLSQQPA